MDAPGPRSGAGPVVLVLVLAAGASGCVAALLAGGGAPPDLPAGMVDAGPVVGWGLPLTRLAALVAGASTVGSLLVASVLGPDRPGPVRTALLAAGTAAAAWSLTGVAGHLLTVGDAAGVPPWSLGAGRLLPPGAGSVATAHLAAAVLAAAVAAGAVVVRTRSAARALLVVGLGATLPVPVVGHVGSVEDGGQSLAGLVVHVVAATIWTGGLAGLLVHLRTDAAALASAVPRFSVLALGAYVALAGSGVLALAAALPFTGVRWQEAWSSGYAAVVAAKVVLLVVLGCVGLRHRRRTVPGVLNGEPGSFVRLATGEAVLMAAAAGLATALARTPVPPREAVGHGGQVAEQPTPVGLLLTWRPHAVVLLVLGIAVAAYLHGVRRRGASGRPWPLTRTASFLAGAALTVVSLCSAVAVYAPLLLSVHLAQLCVVVLVVPALLLLGRPAALLRPGTTVPVSLGRVCGRPAPGAIATCLLLLAVHRTPVVLLSLASPWWHLLVLAVALVCGLALVWPVLGSPAPSTETVVAWAGWLLPVVACLALLALQLRSGERLLGAEWFLELRLGWSDPVEDQHRAGTVAGLVAAVLAAVALTTALVARTRRSAPSPAPPLRTRPPAQNASSTRPRRSSDASAP